MPFAQTSWDEGDIISMYPDMTKDQASLFLEKYENKIVDAMVSGGWTMIEICHDGENGE